MLCRSNNTNPSLKFHAPVERAVLCVSCSFKHTTRFLFLPSRKVNVVEAEEAAALWDILTFCGENSSWSPVLHYEAHSFPIKGGGSDDSWTLLRCDADE